MMKLLYRLTTVLLPALLWERFSQVAKTTNITK